MYSPTPQDTLKYTTLATALAAAFAAGPMPDNISATPQPGPGGVALQTWEDPDTFGHAILNGITNPDYVDVFHGFLQLRDTIPIDTFARGCVDDNIWIANGEVYAGMVGWESVLIDETIDAQTGKHSYAMHKPRQLLPKHMAWPPITWKGFDLRTAAGVVAYVNQLEPRVTNGGRQFVGV
jgi:hypothetical protein